MKTTLTIRDAVPVLAATWLSEYLQALKEGLRAKPTGEWTEDPHCRAAVVLSSRTVGSFWPKSYGGHDTDRPRGRWSATNRACLHAFERGIKLGLLPSQAARAMREGRRLAREKLGIHPNSRTPIEVWIGLNSQERAVEVLRCSRVRSKIMMEYVVRCTNNPRWVSPGESYPDYVNNYERWRSYNQEFANLPLSSENQLRRETNLAIVSADLAAMADW